jgi:prepilin-type N-terminal cleavage/methylation domain-containing protein
MSDVACRHGITDRNRERAGRGPRPASGGFTLLEVVVAITLLGMVLGIALEIMAVGLRSAGASGDFTQEVLLAKRKLQDLSLQAIAPQSLAGEADAYQWTAEIAPAEGGPQDLPPRLFTLRVRAWRTGASEARRVELVTYRVGGESPVTTLSGPVGSQTSQPAGQNIRGGAASAPGRGSGQ